MYQQRCEVASAASESHGCRGRGCKGGLGKGEWDLVLHFSDLVLQVIAAEGEQKASGALKAASKMIACSPVAMQLQYLQGRM